MLASRLFSSLEIIHAGSLTVVCQKTQFSIIRDLLFSVEAAFFEVFFLFFFCSFCNPRVLLCVGFDSAFHHS